MESTGQTLEVEVQQKKTPATGRAAVLSAPGKFEIAEVKVPEPAAGEVLIRIKGCGLCASSIPVWQGRDWFDYPQEPGAPGHEGWGVVEAVGAGVTELEEGDVVAALSYKAYADFDIASAGSVVKLPTFLQDKPFPAEPLACAMNIFSRSDIREGQTVAIIGIGFLGALLTQLAKNAGARVIALSQREFSLETARENGADITIPLDDHYKIIEDVKKITDGEFCDRVIECTGKEWPLNLAGELTKVRGRLTIAGFHQDGMRQVNVQLWNWRGLDIINAHERDPEEYVRGMRAAVEAVAFGDLDPYPLFTHHFKLSEMDEAFKMLETRPEGFIKALIEND